MPIEQNENGIWLRSKDGPLLTIQKRILGIDPGYARLGWGIIDVINDEPRLVEYGCFETPKDEEFPQRLAMIYGHLEILINQHEPDDIVIEELFFGKNTRTAMNVAHARGVIMLCAVSHTGKIFKYRPNQVKTATTGDIKAKKPDIQEAVRIILNLESIPKSDDAADALAIALTHARLSQAQVLAVESDDGSGLACEDASGNSLAITIDEFVGSEVCTDDKWSLA